MQESLKKYDNENEKPLAENIRLGFINLIGEETEGLYRYEFIFTDKIDEFWGEGFEYTPACLVNDLKPLEEYVYEVHVMKTKIKLDLIQNNCCFGMQDCMDGIVGLGWEDISRYDAYPDDGRLFFYFGETYEDVERKLAMKNILFFN